MTDNPNTYSIQLTPQQSEVLVRILQRGNFRPVDVPYARIAVEGTDCRVALYPSNKCVVQGKGARDFVLFVLEPHVLKEARLGYEEIREPASFEAHIGVDESGKGDFFGPLVVAAVYVDPQIVRAFRELNVRDSKRVSSDRQVLKLEAGIRKVVGKRLAVVMIGPRKYNELYAKMGNVNRLLGWAHARALENVLEVVPACSRALADQFGPRHQIEQALLKKGRRLQLEQRPKAEADPAVAAASIVARAAFVRALKRFEEQYGIALPKGASAAVREAAKKLVEKKGPQVLLEVAKCHFRTTDEVLAEASLTREALGPLGQKVSRDRRGGEAPR